MEIKKDIAMKLWNDVFKEQIWAQDCFGTWMHRDDYGIYNKTRNNRPNGTGKDFIYGWDIDHIRPSSTFNKDSESNFFNNFEPMHHTNNSQKSNGYTNFAIDNVEYRIVECDICKKHNREGYGILKIATNKRVDWKFIQNKYYN